MDNQTLISLLLLLYALGMVPMGVTAKRTCADMQVDAPFRVLIVCLLWPLFAVLGLLYGLLFAE